ncbi:MAG: hypothetical protein ACE5F6_21775 [Anaerolineae bacterium]
MTQIQTADNAGHIFGVRCAAGHVTYFDKRKVCPDTGTLIRKVVRKADKELDELYLKCGEADCQHEIVVQVDCEGYK